MLHCKGCQEPGQAREIFFWDPSHHDSFHLSQARVMQRMRMGSPSLPPWSSSMPAFSFSTSFPQGSTKQASKQGERGRTAKHLTAPLSQAAQLSSFPRQPANKGVTTLLPGNERVGMSTHVPPSCPSYLALGSPNSKAGPAQQPRPRPPQTIRLQYVILAPPSQQPCAKFCTHIHYLLLQFSAFSIVLSFHFPSGQFHVRW